MADDIHPTNYGALWTREELILAFDLYCRIPFNKTKADNPEIIELARLLGRSPASIARKLGNFGAFDPELQQRHVSGLAHTSKMDREIWDEFNGDWSSLVLEARRLRLALNPDSAPVGSEEDDSDMAIPQGASERAVLRKARVHQTFFREAVLSSYDASCCITGLRIPECLIASHIIPWSVSEEHRADPRNGLCLSATFDRLFDRGLITVTGSLCVVVSAELLNAGNKQIDEMVCRYHGKGIARPRRFLPSDASLDWHRSNVFRG